MTGYTKFLEYIERLFHQEPSTYGTEEKLISSGVPINAIRQLLSLNWNQTHNLYRLVQSHRHEVLEERRSLIRRWYDSEFRDEQLPESESFTVVTLDMLIRTYNEKGLLIHPNEVLNTLYKLYQLGYYFPHIPTRKDAYLAGLITSTGHIEDGRYTVEVQENEKDLYHVNKILKLRGSVINDNLRLPAGLGRVLSLLDVPVGDKFFSDSEVPYWILDSRPFQEEYLAGLCDGRLSFGANITLRISRDEKKRESLVRFLNQIQGTFRAFGIHHRSYVYPIKEDYIHDVEGHIVIQRKKRNLEKLLSLPLKFPSKVGRIRSLSLSNHLNEEDVFEYICTLDSVTTRDVAERFNRSVNTAHHHLTKLHESGRIQKRLLNGRTIWLPLG